MLVVPDQEPQPPLCSQNEVTALGAGFPAVLSGGERQPSHWASRAVVDGSTLSRIAGASSIFDRAGSEHAARRCRNGTLTPLTRLHLASYMGANKEALRPLAEAGGADMASFEEFKQSEKGQKVGAILADHDWQVEMICLSKHGLPAAQAVGAEIETKVGDLDDTEKQHVGRWIREVMAEKGWKVASKGARVAPGNYFSRAATYTLAGACLTMDDPITLRMQQIIDSPQGRHAATAAASAGLPAMAGVDPLLSTALGADYGKHNFATATAGDLVAKLMRSLGYTEAGSRSLPAHCVAKRAMMWTPKTEGEAKAA